MNIVAELNAFDGKHTDVLEALVARLEPSVVLIQELCAIAESSETKLQTSATWLLKRFQENGVSLSSAQVEDCLGLLGRVTHWEARLHLLQMLPKLVVPAGWKNAVHQLLLTHLNDGNKFVRAWSYNGLAELATQYPEYQEDVAELLKTGQQTEAASVRARIRNILKTAQWASAAR